MRSRESAFFEDLLHKVIELMMIVCSNFLDFFFEKVPFIFGVEEESKNRIMSKRKKNAQKKELQKKKKKNKRKKKDIGTFFREK